MNKAIQKIHAATVDRRVIQRTQHTMQGISEI
jgi:hypothetical protein